MIENYEKEFLVIFYALILFISNFFIFKINLGKFQKLVIFNKCIQIRKQYSKKLKILYSLEFFIVEKGKISFEKFNCKDFLLLSKNKKSSGNYFYSSLINKEFNDFN